MSDFWGVVFSFVYVGLVLGASALLARVAKWAPEATRKFAHIALGGWWVLAMLFFSGPVWAAVPPAAFVAVNWVAWRKEHLRFLQRGEAENTPGTVYYAVSLLALALFSFGAAAPYVGALGVFCMALGDGFAAVLGGHLHSRRFTIVGGRKSVVGFAAMFLFSFAACLVTLLVFAPRGAVGIALFLAVVATALEAISPRGLDNLAVPFGISGLYYLLFYPGANIMWRAVVAGVLLSGAVVLLAWGQNLLTLPAGVGAVAVGTLLFAAGGWALWVLLIWFFTSSNLAAKLLARRWPGRKRKSEGARKLRQVLANSVPAAVCALAYMLGGSAWFLVLAAGALAACTADTWASEIGVYSKRDPVSILTLRPVQRGLSGGVSPLGLGASAVAAVCTGLLAMGVFHAMDAAIPTSPPAFLLVVGCGIAGSLLDSVLGVCLQAKYRCKGAVGLVEHAPSGTACTLVSGLRWVTNDVVNFFSGALVVLAALPVAVL